jgi:cysteine-rich repeat protein
MRRLIVRLAALAILVTGALGQPAAAQPLGSFLVGEGPVWVTNPPTYTCLEACALVLGGAPNDYSCSTSDAAIDHSAWVSGWGSQDHCSSGTAVAEDFKVGTTYDCGSAGCAYSAYVGDYCGGDRNYCWAAPTPTVCGNGVIEPGEACDDGNSIDGDCCSNACQALPDGTSCADGDACNGEETCQAGACASGSPPFCEDDDPCTHEHCDSVLGCVPGNEPLLQCNETAEAATLTIDGPKQKLAYSWSKGSLALADLGDPIGSDPYTVCLYDAEGSVHRLVVDNGGTCGKKSCWKATGDAGFAYKDKAGVQDGVRSLKLKAGDAGKAKLSLAASGENLGEIDLGTTGLVAPVTVQILNAQDQCFGASFEAEEIKTNDGFKVKAKHSGAAPN